MLIQVVKEGEKNFSLLVRGIAGSDFGPAPVVDLGKVRPPREGWKGLRLDSAAWAIQEKMGLLLMWEEEIEEKNLILPMESRNSLRFDEGVPSPRVGSEWGGKIWVSSFRCYDPVGDKAFFFILDFDKQ